MQWCKDTKDFAVFYYLILKMWSFYLSMLTDISEDMTEPSQEQGEGMIMHFG